MEGTPTILEIEDAILALLDQPLKGIGVKTYKFPDDWKESGRPFVKNSAIISFAGMDLDEPLSAGKGRACIPTYQTVSWTYNILITSQRLSCGNPSNPAIYAIIDTVVDEVCGNRPFPDMGPIWSSSVDYTGRENGCWMFTITVNIEGKKACVSDENALLAPFAPAMP